MTKIYCGNLKCKFNSGDIYLGICLIERVKLVPMDNEVQGGVQCYAHEPLRDLSPPKVEEVTKGRWCRYNAQHLCQEEDEDCQNCQIRIDVLERDIV